MRFDVPTQGLVLNVPPDKVGTNGLIAGNNVFVDLDGLLKPRLGTTQVASNDLTVTEPGIGIYPYEDNTGIFYPIVGSPTRWYANISNTWTDISGGTLLTGNINDPVRFCPFASGGFDWVIGCNNNDKLYEWHSALAQYQVISAAPIARDVLCLANRVVAFNTVESGTRFNYRVRWSSLNDETTWGAGNYADLADSACSIVGAALTSRTSAVIYREWAAWYIYAVPGSDANAFAFDRLPAGDHMTGPSGPNSIVIAEGSHYYFGIDGRIYQFNGTSVQPISDPIDPLIRGLYNNAELSRYSSCYVPAYRQLCFFFAIGGETPNACIVFDLRRQAFEPLWTFPFNVTSSAEVRESAGVTWSNWVSPTDTWMTINYATWADIPSGSQQSTYIATDLGQVSRLATGSMDRTSPIPYSATWPLQRVQDETTNGLVHYFEIYVQSNTIDAEIITATLNGFFQPLAPANTITSLTLNLTDSSTFQQTVAPGPLNANNIKSNLLQLVLQAGGNNRRFEFAGASLLVDFDLRGDYKGNGIQ